MRSLRSNENSTKKTIRQTKGIFQKEDDQTFAVILLGPVVQMQSSIH